MEERKRSWTQDELRIAREAVEPYPYGGPFIDVAECTGLRLEEAFGLKVEHVEQVEHRGEPRLLLRVPGTKTAAAKREVPVCRRLEPLVRRLVDGSDQNDGFLLSNPSKTARRGHTVSQEVGRRMKRAGLKDPSINRHSLRRCFITYLLQAGVPQHVAELLDGHKPKSMSYGEYAEGLSVPQMFEAIDSVPQLSMGACTSAS